MKTAIYARVSTNRQTQSQTIEQQLERLERHLELQGERLLAENIFRDDGYSGANLNRPGLDRLRDRVKGGMLDRVLLTSPDRLARNYVHQMVLMEEWERSGCKVEFLDRPMSQDPHDHLLLQIRGAVAEYERVLIAERMRRGRQMKLKAGTLLPWTTPPYGYRSAPDRPRDPAAVQIEPAEGAVVRELFARYLEDKGTLLGLAKHLLQLRLPSPRGNPRWSVASIRGLLINPVYTGQLYIGRSRSRPARIRRSATHPLGNPAHGQEPTPAEAWTWVGTVPALISQEEFNRVQAKLALNKKQAARNNKGYRYLLRGWLVAGPVNRPALRGPPTEDCAITSAAVRPSRSTRSMITGVIPAAYPLTSWTDWYGRTCASSFCIPTTSPEPCSELAAETGCRSICKPVNRRCARRRRLSASSWKG